MQDCFYLNNTEKKRCNPELLFSVFPSLGKNSFIFYCNVRHVGISGWLLHLIYVFTASFLQMYVPSTSDRLVFVKMASVDC